MAAFETRPPWDCQFLPGRISIIVEGMFAKRRREKQVSQKDLLSQKKSKPPDEPIHITIHLDETTLAALGLKLEDIITISDIKYLANITDRLFYLFDIVSRVCDCPIEAVTLYRQADGELRDENDVGWQLIDQQAPLKGGFYLCKCKEGLIPQSCILTDLDNCKKLELDPVLISSGGQPKSRMSTPLTSRPNSSDGRSNMSSTSAEQFSPGKISSLLKQAASNRATNNVALDILKKKVRKRTSI